MKQSSIVLISLFIAGALTACNGGGFGAVASNSTSSINQPATSMPVNIQTINTSKSTKLV